MATSETSEVRTVPQRKLALVIGIGDYMQAIENSKMRQMMR